MNLCTSTDAALSWLLSLSATCTSSPFRPSSPADYTDNDTFTDWLHISSSPSPTRPSSRVNYPQDKNTDIFLPYNDGSCNVLNNSDPVQACAWHQAARAGGSSDSTLSTSDTTSLVSTYQDQMYSSSSTLVDSPSPRPLVNAFLSPSASTNQNYRHHAHTAPQSSPPLNPPMFHSPASKLINELAISPFGSYLNLDDPSTTSLALPSMSFSDISPVVRASRTTEDPLLIDKENEVPMKRKKKNKTKTRISKTITSTFLEKLQSAPPNPPTLQQQLPATPPPLPAYLPGNLDLPDRAPSEKHLLLLSPVKLRSPQALSPVTHISDTIISQSEPCIIPALVFPTPPRPPFPTNYSLSPLSPLTPLSSPERSQPLKIKIVLKRKNADPTTPIRRTKRPRRSHIVPITTDLSSPITSPPTSVQEAEPSQDENPSSAYTNRTLPNDIQISLDFPLLYRRFPASSYYQPPDADSPCTLFGPTHPGGNYNPPRRVFDLYTPRFVKGRGVEKVGLCPVCIEPVNRGGENKRLWFAMKFSAFKCYHMQYAHGISASTGKPFSPPTAFRIVRRQNVGKHEKSHIQEGKCHKCSKWVVVEGIKDMECKVPELYWWKHAATCHHDLTLEGEGDYFEEDDVYDTLVSFEQPQA